jgi:hypothetical protein
MKKIRFFSLLSFFIIFAVSCNDEEQPLNVVSNQSVSGYFITDEGTPISNAIVEATDGEGKLFSTSTTNELGSFEVNNIPANTDNAIVSFVKDGAVIKQLKLGTLVKIAKKGENVFLGGQYDYEAVFAVKVIDASSEESIENALVQLYTSDKAKFEANTNTDGYAYFPSIVPGRYHFYITHDDYKSYGESLLLLFPEGMDTVSFTFPLTRKSNTDPKDSTNTDSICCDNSIRLKVYIKTNTGTTAPYVGEIRVVNSFVSKEIRKTTDAHGYVEFTDLCSGRTFIEVVDDEYIGYIDQYNYDKNTILLGCGNYVEASMLVEKKPFTKCCDNVLVIYYQDKNGDVITCDKATITDLKGSNSNYMKSSISGNGAAVFSGLCNDKKHVYRTNVMCDDKSYESADISVEFNCTDTVVVTQKLKLIHAPQDSCNNAVRIILKDTANHKYIDDASGEIKGGPNNVTIPLTFARGIVDIKDLCTGRYTIYISTECGFLKDNLDVYINGFEEKVFYFGCP